MSVGPSDPEVLAMNIQTTEDEQRAGSDKQLCDWSAARFRVGAQDSGPFQRLATVILQALLEGEISAHLLSEGQEKNTRNGARSRTVLTDVGPLRIEVPRDRGGSFKPQIIQQRRRCLSGVEDMTLYLASRGRDPGEIRALLGQFYGAETCPRALSVIAESVIQRMADWQGRSLKSVYPVVFIERLALRRDATGPVSEVCAALGVAVDGTRDIFGLWADRSLGNTLHWNDHLAELGSRGVHQVSAVVCSAHEGLSAAVERHWPGAMLHEIDGASASENRHGDQPHKVVDISSF